MNIFTSHSPFHPGNLKLSYMELGDVRCSSSNRPIVGIFKTSLYSGAPVFSVGPCIPLSSYIPSTLRNCAGVAGRRVLSIGVPRRGTLLLPGGGLTTLGRVLRLSPQPKCSSSPRGLCNLDFTKCGVGFSIGGSMLYISSVRGVGE